VAEGVALGSRRSSQLNTKHFCLSLHKLHDTLLGST
jgi:hypothetical protein